MILSLGILPYCIRSRIYGRVIYILGLWNCFYYVHFFDLSEVWVKTMIDDVEKLHTSVHITRTSQDGCLLDEFWWLYTNSLYRCLDMQQTSWEDFMCHIKCPCAITCNIILMKVLLSLIFSKTSSKSFFKLQLLLLGARTFFLSGLLILFYEPKCFFGRNFLSIALFALS